MSPKEENSNSDSGTSQNAYVHGSLSEGMKSVTSGQGGASSYAHMVTPAIETGCVASAAATDPRSSKVAFAGSPDVETGFIHKGTPRIATGFAERDLTIVAQQFKEAVTVGRHRYRLRNYDDTFVGREAVTYMCLNGMAPTRQDAVFLGQLLMKEMNLFSHVTKEHNFEDANLFYQYEQSASGAVPFLEKDTTDTEGVTGVDAADFLGMLVAVSGSPNFEIDMLKTLRELGVPKKHAITFHAGTVQL